jgi:hypothetical protein
MERQVERCCEELEKPSLVICADAVCCRGLVERLALTKIARPALALAPRADRSHLGDAAVPMPCQPNAG